MLSTYCNPLPLPDYQRGEIFRRGYIGPDFREMADPTVIRFEGRWYLFPSCGMLWHSDNMVDWTFRPIEPFNFGYAPTVVQRKDWLYLTACGGNPYSEGAIWRARHPFGPWEKMGKPGRDEDGNPAWLRDRKGHAVRWSDPCLFVDDDGAMYCYHNWYGVNEDPLAPWKLKECEGIYGTRLCDDDPTVFASDPARLIAHNPAHRWELYGEYNQRPVHVCLEGAWMTKHQGRYYLQYSTVGTQFKNYAVGCYVGDGPLGPFRPQKRNPILIHRGGLVNGCAHHSIVEGPDGNLWCFYTTLVGIAKGGTERRIGMDPVGFDADGEMSILGPTETPQFAPGIVATPANGNDAGLLPLTVNQPVRASSHKEGREPEYAVDNVIRTWWEAATDQGPQWLQVDMEYEYQVYSGRTLFGDRGLSYPTGVVPGPYSYRIEGSCDEKTWTVLCDRSGNAVDRHIAYDTWEPRKARFVRLVVLSAPPGMRISIWEFTVFGRAEADSQDRTS
jgi:xylan 1,4-beta-xylosidase